MAAPIHAKKNIEVNCLVIESLGRREVEEGISNEGDDDEESYPAKIEEEELSSIDEEEEDEDEENDLG